MYKQFSESLYTKHDKIAKKAVIKWARECGYSILENSDRYGVDLLLQFGVEIEQRPCWNGENFPFSTIHIPSRKAKFMNGRNKYVIVNNDSSYCLVIDGSEIKSSPKVNNPNKYMDEEMFYDVSKSKFKLHKL